MMEHITYNMEVFWVDEYNEVKKGNVFAFGNRTAFVRYQCGKDTQVKSFILDDGELYSTRDKAIDHAISEIDRRRRPDSQLSNDELAYQRMEIEFLESQRETKAVGLL